MQFRRDAQIMNYTPRPISLLHFSPREIDLRERLMTDRREYSSIAHDMGITTGTLKSYVNRIFEKSQCTSRDSLLVDEIVRLREEVAALRALLIVEDKDSSAETKAVSA